MYFGIGVALQAGVAGFNADDTANGTLILGFVSTPPITLDMNFNLRTYSQWQDDPAQPGLSGYYQVKG